MMHVLSSDIDAVSTWSSGIRFADRLEEMEPETADWAPSKSRITLRDRLSASLYWVSHYRKRVDGLIWWRADGEKCCRL